MVPSRLHFRRIQVFLVLFACSALAALQNVTIDDTALTGAVIPRYNPPAVWNQGNDCSICHVKPDPSLAYNGTWHDTTYLSTNNYIPGIEFKFTRSAIYVFFIIANNVPDATTTTNVNFFLDDNPINTYTHTPSTSSDYQYNVLVYANDSLIPGQHHMAIQASNPAVLILFDYLIYTTEASGPPSSGPHEMLNIGPIVASIVALVVIASVLCYRRYKGRNREAVAEPYIPSSEMTPESRPKAKTLPRPPVCPESSIPSVSISPSSALSFSDNTALIEQVEFLRDEVARLRYLHESRWNAFELPPPEYMG